MLGWDTLISRIFQKNFKLEYFINKFLIKTQRIIDNKATRNFEHKKNRLLSIISKLIGRPQAKKLRNKRRFLLDLRKIIKK